MRVEDIETCNFDRVGDDIANAYDEGYKEGGEAMYYKIFEALYTWLRLEEISKDGFVHIQKIELLRKFRNLHLQLIGEAKDVRTNN